MKKFLGMLVVFVMIAVLLVGCGDPIRGLLTATTETPAPSAILIDGGVLCTSNTLITYRTYEVHDTYNCDQDGYLIVSYGQNLKGLVTISNYSPVKGEIVTGTYDFTKTLADQSKVTLDDCEISTNSSLHERVSNGKFTILAKGETTTYTLRCVDGNKTIDAQFTLRAPAYGG